MLAKITPLYQLAAEYFTMKLLPGFYFYGIFLYINVRSNDSNLVRLSEQYVVCLNTCVWQRDGRHGASGFHSADCCVSTQTDSRLFKPQVETDWLTSP